MSQASSDIPDPVERILDHVRNVKGWTKVIDGIHYLECDLCGKAVKLSKMANMHNMEQHRRGRYCKPSRSASTSAPSPTPNPDVNQTRFHPYHSRHQSRSSSIQSNVNSRSSSVHSPLSAARSSSRFRDQDTLQSDPPPPSPTPSYGGTQSIDWMERDCPGVSLKWKAGSMLATYPFQLHASHDVGWVPISFNRQENEIILRSDHCKRMPKDPDGNPCRPCAVMRSSASLQKAMERAKNAPKGTPYEYLTAQQMRVMLHDFNRTMRQLRTQVYNLKQQIAGARRKLDDYGRIMMLLSKGDVPGLRRILAVSLKRGASPLVIINLLERALKGLHRARGGFSARDLDISFLAKAIGGPKLLYSLQKAFGLASETTLRREKKIPAFLASVGRPIATEVNANINTFADPEINPAQAPTSKGERVGVTLMWDGVALEARCSYCQLRGHVLGICREHSDRVNTYVEDLGSVQTIQEALFEPETPDKKVCFATEATVVAWGSYHPTRYNATPLIASPACKSEGGGELRKWLVGVVVDTWKKNPLGAATHGDIWAMASDGDAVYRYAKYLECLENGVEVDTSRGYGARLKDLEGLNLYTSKDGILGTCDPKHIFKRFATLLRNTSGCMVGQTNIKSVDILKHLAGHDGLSEEAVRELLNPTDKQNVPKAVSLLQRLNELEEDATLDPSDQHRRSTLVFLGKFFYLFLEPFINVKMDLSAQVESLSAFAHVAAALYMQHQTASLTGALYADTQAVIKNIIFTIARMQEIDEDLLLYILQEGTDRLETLFGETRTQDHSSNYDIKQFCEKAAIGALIHATYARNPDLDRGHRRLSLFGALGIDHVNSRSWEGNVRVGDVNLKKCWDAGRARALSLLKKYLHKSFTIPDFLKIWKEPKRDLLRPKGIYVGTRRTDDDVRSEDDSDITPLPVPLPSTSTLIPPSIVPGESPDMDLNMPEDNPQGSTDDLSVSAADAYSAETLDLVEGDTADDDSDSMTSVEMASPTEDVTALAPPNVISMSEIQGAHEMVVGDELEGDGDDLPIGIDLDDYFSDEGEETPNATGTPGAYLTDGARLSESGSLMAKKPSKFIIVEGKEKHKSSVVASLLSSKWSKKYGDRLLRVRGLAKGVLTKLKDNDFEDSSLGEDQIKAGDIAAVLARDASEGGTDSSMPFALSVVEITSFALPGERGTQTAIDFAALESPKIKIMAQILELAFDRASSSWDWTGNYLRIGSSSKSSEIDTHKQYVVEVDGALVYPLNPRTVKYNGRKSDSSLATTWRLTTKELDDAAKAAWSSLNPETEEIVVNIELLPMVNNGKMFPYKDDKGTSHFGIEKSALPQQLKDIARVIRANATVSCKLCGKEEKMGKMVEHVGRHILHASRYPNGPEVLQQQPGSIPCGFCGRDGCFTQLKKCNKKSLVIVSTCPYRRSKMVPCSSFTEFDPQNPCRNTPVYCSLCPKTASGDPRTIWRYNAGMHLMMEHAGTSIPPALLLSIFISKKEEGAMGIEEEATDEFRDLGNQPGTDSLLETAMEFEERNETSVDARGRSETITGRSQRLEKQKRK